jgi:hypothetical protein
VSRSFAPAYGVCAALQSVIHVIDSGNLYPTFAPPDSFTTLADFAEWMAPSAGALLAASSLRDALADPSSPFTAFLPTDTVRTCILAQCVSVHCGAVSQCTASWAAGALGTGQSPSAKSPALPTLTSPPAQVGGI